MSTDPLGSHPVTAGAVVSPLAPQTSPSALQNHSSQTATTREHLAVESAENGAEQSLHHEESAVSAQSNLRHHVVVDTRPMIHKYVFRRPRALQYYHEGNLVEAHNSHEARDVVGGKDIIVPLGYRDRIATQMIPLPKGSDADSRSTDKPVVQRKRLDLFIDLLWVGIISNISEHFTVQAFETEHYGYAFLEFLVLFLLAFEIWNSLREFLNDWFIDDLLQRAFVLWTLVLALLYGNNTMYFTDNESITGTVIGLFLVATAGFVVREWLYSFFVPELRRMVIWNTIMAIPSWGLCIGAIFVKWPYSSILLLASFLITLVHRNIMNSPIGDRLVSHGWRKAPDAEHLVDRLESFFIIIIGEGVFLLIKDSPLGSGIGHAPGDGVMVLIIYSVIFILYFNGDQSRNYIHAVRRSWWGARCWIMIHIPLYASVLLLDASLLYLVKTDLGGSSNTAGEHAATIAARHLVGIIHARQGSSEIEQMAAGETPEERAHYHRVATWTAAVALAVTISCTIIMALINRSLDRPGTLIVDNRFLRLIPRAVLIPIFLCLPIKQDIEINTFIVIIMALLLVVSYTEFLLSLEKGAKLVEPKPKTGMGSDAVEKRGLM